MNRYITYLLLILTIVSCNEEIQPLDDPLNANAVELKGAEAYIAGSVSTRAAALDAYNYVGRSTFINNDQMVLTTIKRTLQTIPGFNYSGIVYNHIVEQSQTSGGWNRDNSKGRTAASEQVPERIYWSDSHNGHTYIGYSVPQGDFDWTEKEAAGIPVYYGSLGNPTIEGIIDYTNTVGEDPKQDKPGDPNSAFSYKTGNDKIQKDDILLTWDNEKLAETGGSVAKLYFHHGLAQVRVIVNIQGFSASTDAVDTKSKVSDMILKKMLTLYKWRQLGYAAEALDADIDASNITDLYGSGVTCDQKKDVHLWIPRPDGTGSGTGKQFTFYALAVPCSMGVDNASTDAEKEQNLHFEFSVTYPDPMYPEKNVTMTYKAMMPNHVEFRAGHCTTINISLNHNNEKMTIGAEYMDWQLVETPDQGELKKNDTFLDNTDRSSVTILGDPNANEDDATWLYVDKTTKRILDIYGNNGSEDHPFKISTANQLLSFAYEVKGTSRRSTPYKDLDDADQTMSGGFDFTGYWVTLDADITMQESLDIWHDSGGFYQLGSENAHDYSVNPRGVTWPSIGDATHRFNGVFNGGYRHINRLYGAPFFNTIGEDGIVDHLFISDALGITGRGSMAEVNYGVICGAYIEGNVVAINNGTMASSYCGSIVGENHSMLISCTHIGDITGEGYESVGALLGYNDGIVAICYNCGDVRSNGTHQYAGIGEYSPKSIAYCCYYNGDLYTGQDYERLDHRIGHVAFPLTTAMMQSNTFVNKYAPYDGLTKEHEIIDDGLGEKTDPFFFHLSLNYGIRRAVAMLKMTLSQTPDSEGKIIIHNVTAGEPNPYEVLKLKKTLVEWLIRHYSNVMDTEDKTKWEFSHQFQFIPGTYPKLQ